MQLDHFEITQKNRGSESLVKLFLAEPSEEIFSDWSPNVPVLEVEVDQLCRVKCIYATDDQCSQKRRIAGKPFERVANFVERHSSVLPRALSSMTLPHTEHNVISEYEQLRKDANRSKPKTMYAFPVHFTDIFNTPPLVLRHALCAAIDGELYPELKLSLLANTDLRNFSGSTFEMNLFLLNQAKNFIRVVIEKAPFCEDDFFRTRYWSQPERETQEARLLVDYVMNAGEAILLMGASNFVDVFLDSEQTGKHRKHEFFVGQSRVIGVVRHDVLNAKEAIYLLQEAGLPPQISR